MTHFNEENTVEQMVLDTFGGSVTGRMIAEELPRQHSNVLLESKVRDALIRLNPEIKVQPDRTSTRTIRRLSP